MRFDVDACRALFPALTQHVNHHPLVYLDNAATTHKPQPVLDALLHHYQFNNANVHRGSHALGQSATQAFEQARAQVKDFINAQKVEEIIWARGATEAINLVANTFGKQLNAGDEIIVSALEHHANFVPWQQLAQAKNLHLKVIPLKDNYTLDLEAFGKLITPNTKLIAVNHVSNALGTINPIKHICAKAKQQGITTLIDGAQAVGHLEVDVQAIGCDFYVFSGHKLFGPTGIGVLYGRYDLLTSLPPWQLGGEMVARVSVTDTSYQHPPLKFEAGTPPAAEAVALAEAIRFKLHAFEQGADKHEVNLHHYFRKQLSAIPELTLHLPPPDQHCSAFSFTAKGHHIQDIAKWLDHRGIAVRTGHHCAMPLMQRLSLDGTLRASLSVYNTHDDIDALINALKEALSQQTLTQETTHKLADALSNTKDWQSRYRLLLLAGKQAPRYPHIQTDQNLVAGCESNTWVNIENGVLVADSDAKIMRGILSLISELYPTHSLADMQNAFKHFGLEHNLSESRSNGITAILTSLYTD